MSTRLGACVQRARLHARFGRPMPTKTTSPSLSSRAATADMSSAGEKLAIRREPLAVSSVAVVDPGADLLVRPEPLDQPRMPGEIVLPAGHAMHVLVQIRLQ